MAERQIQVGSLQAIRNLFGRQDEHLRLLEEALGLRAVVRDDKIVLIGSEEQLSSADPLVRQLVGLVQSGHPLKRHEILYAISAMRTGQPVSITELVSYRVEVWSKRQAVTPQTARQKAYVEAMRQNDLVFGIGPAGTGKTYLAMAMAVESLKKERVSRIVLTRPAVEAGESLGYLPGTMYEKVSPYLRPLYDALYDVVDSDRIEHLMARGTIEVAPLAYMRGRTLNDAFVILDEAQNTSPEQMKMFLTRIGFDSKVVITGDITQVDLPTGKTSGLIQVQAILKDIAGLQFIYFSSEDVVRHRLVSEIVAAYESKRVGPA